MRKLALETINPNYGSRRVPGAVYTSFECPIDRSSGPPDGTVAYRRSMLHELAPEERNGQVAHVQLVRRRSGPRLAQGSTRGSVQVV